MELLKKVKKVDAPYFMLTRIQAKIRANVAERTPVSWKLVGTMAFCTLLMLNVFLFIGTEESHLSNGAKSLAAGMKLQSDNQLYDE